MFTLRKIRRSFRIWWIPYFGWRNKYSCREHWNDCVNAHITSRSTLFVDASEHLKRSSTLPPSGDVDTVQYKYLHGIIANFSAKCSSIHWHLLVAVETDLPKMVIYFGLDYIVSQRKKSSCLRHEEKRKPNVVPLYGNCRNGKVVFLSVSRKRHNFENPTDPMAPVQYMKKKSKEPQTDCH